MGLDKGYGQKKKCWLILRERLKKEALVTWGLGKDGLWNTARNKVINDFEGKV